MHQECILVGCVPPACCPYLLACTAPGGGGLYLQGDVPAWGECDYHWGVPARGDTCPGRCTCQGVPARGRYLLGGVPAQGGCTCWRVYLLGGVPAGGYTCHGVYLPRGCTCPGGVPAKGIVSCPGTAPPPPVNRMTERCKNITLPQTSFAGGKYMKELKLVYFSGLSISPFVNWI